MGEVKHTPGPWRAREGTSTGMEVVAKKPRGGDYIVARCGGKDREANARLIELAPDMLASLRWCADVLQDAGVGYGPVDKIIARAEGRS